MQDKNNPLKSSRLLIYVITAIVAPVAILVLIYLTTDPFSAAFGSPDTQTEVQRQWMYILMYVMFASPVLAPLLAFFYFRQRNKHFLRNRESVTDREAHEIKQARGISRKNQLIILGLAVVGILLIKSGPALFTDAKYRWADMQESLRYSTAIKKGCRDITPYDIQNSSKIVAGHYLIISRFGYETYQTTLDNYTMNINSSFDRCARNKITAADQTKLVEDYINFLETTSHKLLAENPLKLSDAEIANFRTFDAENHQ